MVLATVSWLIRNVELDKVWNPCPFPSVDFNVRFKLHDPDEISNRISVVLYATRAEVLPTYFENQVVVLIKMKVRPRLEFPRSLLTSA